MRDGNSKHANRRSLGLLGRDVDGSKVPRLSAVRGRHGSTGGTMRPASGVLEALVSLAEHDGDILPACSIMLVTFSLCSRCVVRECCGNVLWAGCSAHEPEAHSIEM